MRCPALAAGGAVKRGRVEFESRDADAMAAERFGVNLDVFHPMPPRLWRITVAGREYLKKLRLEGKAEPEGGKN